jgi:hypothetical protein
MGDLPAAGNTSIITDSGKNTDSPGMVKSANFKTCTVILWKGKYWEGLYHRHLIGVEDYGNLEGFCWGPLMLGEKKVKI